MVSLLSHLIIKKVSRNINDGNSKSTRLNSLSVYLIVIRELALAT